MAVEKTALEWALLPLQRYADFRGRAPRAEYWWFYLATIIVGIVAGVIDAILGDFDAGWVGNIVNLALLVPTIAVTVRRLHDTDRSGWWLLLGILVVVVLVAMVTVAGMSGNMGFTPALVAAVIVTLIVAITLFVFMVLPGNPGPNRYGPDPYGQDDRLEEIFA